MNKSISPFHRTALLPDLAGLFSFLILVVLLLSGGTDKMLMDADTLWHIKAGEVMLEQGTILTKDIFSHTAYSNSWTAHEWLAEIIMGLLHKFGGIPAVTLFYMLLIAFTFWFLYKICCTDTPAFLVVLCVLSGYILSSSHLLARPHIFTWFFGVITLGILQKGPRSKLFYLLPPFAALWANLHGGFLFCILFQVFFIAGQLLDRITSQPRPSLRALFQNIQKPLCILFATVLAVCINPFSYHLLLFPFHATLPIYTQHINEWLSPNFQVFWHYRLYFILVILILFFHAKRVNWTYRLLILFFFNAALTHVRHISLTGIFLCPVWCEVLSPWATKLKHFFKKESRNKDLRLSPYSGPIATLTCFIALLFLFHAYPTKAQNILSSFSAHKRYDPQNALNYLKENPQKGNMFNAYHWGGLLIYNFGPQQKVFIDGRADMFGEKVFGDYIEITKVTEQTNDLLSEYKVDWIFFDSTAPLTLYLKATGMWKEVYTDESIAILARINNFANSSGTANE